MFPSYSLKPPPPMSLAPDVIYRYVTISERLSPAAHSKVRTQALGFANRTKLPAIGPTALLMLAQNETRLAFVEATEEQVLAVVFLAIVQALQTGPGAIGGPEQARLQQISDERAKALETLTNVMKELGDVEKTILDNLKD